MGRIMAMDYGTKKIGLATTDPLQLIASPLDTLKTSEIFGFFERYLRNEVVDCLVVGLPLHKDGQPTFLEAHIKGFIRQFTQKYPEIEIARQDEFLTSKLAKEVIQKTVSKKKDRQDKGLVDQISACILLQDYLGF
jgi:putative Holliday junction resolvase